MQFTKKGENQGFLLKFCRYRFGDDLFGFNFFQTSICTSRKVALEN